MESLTSCRRYHAGRGLRCSCASVRLMQQDAFWANNTGSDLSAARGAEEANAALVAEDTRATISRQSNPQ